MGARACYGQTTVCPLWLLGGASSRGVLPAAAVDLLHLERVRIDAVEAADIDGHHLRCARPFAAREGLDAAGRAEQVVDVVLVELAIRRRALAGCQREGGRGSKRQ